MKSRTLFQVLEETAQKYGDSPALHQPIAGGQLTYSWKQFLDAASEIAAGLRQLGIYKGDIVALNSETRLEFYLADLGILANGSIAAALYPSYPARDLVRTLAAAEASVVFVEDPRTLATLRQAGERDQTAGTSRIRHWILLTGEAPDALSLDSLRASGREALARDPRLLDNLRAEVQPSDPAVLYLTSGATGEPKMALVTHDAIVSNIDMGPAVLPMGPSDATVVFLPSAHIAQRVVMEFLPIRCGMPVTFSESLLKLPQEIRKVRPTIFLAPPRMWERVYTTVCTELRKRPPAARKAFHAALALGIAAAEYRRAGKRVPLRIRVPLGIADRLMFRKVRARFGGRIRVAASGAAPLGKDLAEFYEAIGMPLIEGYGLTEGGVATLNPIDNPRPGSIGRLLPGVEARISEDGELQLRSPSLFREYWRDAATTGEVLRDGWLHTGDIGHVDAEGYYFITGRKKELIVSSTGKKIYPTRVENLFKMEPMVSQVLLIGDRLPFLTALFTINHNVALALKGMEGMEGKSAADLAAAPPVLAEIHQTVQRVNRQLAPFEQIRKYRVLPREFTINDGELTATMKVRRTRVIENFQDQITELYAGHHE